MRPSEPPSGAWLQRAWRSRSITAQLLRPISWVYGALLGLRRWLYTKQWLTHRKLAVPVIVVGNVVAGGAGKTPVTIALIEHLKTQGWSPGVVSRGYGRASTGVQFALQEGHNAAQTVGDEPALIARRCKVPVVVAERRSDAGEALLAQYPAIDILVCDDGLQHLALARDIEICVFSSAGIGNGWLLPAGPLREPWPRAVDFVLHTTEAAPQSPAPSFVVHRRLAQSALVADGQRIPLAALAASAFPDTDSPFVAVAGTAHPEEFFSMLRACGVALIHTVALPDHFDFDSWNPNLDKRERLICTEKDAVKLWRRFPSALAVPLELEIAPEFFTTLDAKLASLRIRTRLR